MKLRYSLTAGAALLGVLAFAGPALAMEQIHIPDATAAENSGPPDALFDKSVPTSWQKKSEQQQSTGMGNFHFSATGGSGYGQSSSGFGEDAAKPNSEFHQNGTPIQDPYFPQ
jgi:hypothetical protein